MNKAILEMTEKELAEAQPTDLDAAIAWRLYLVNSIIWADLDAGNDRFPGFGDKAKLVVADELESMAYKLRTRTLLNWKRAAD